MREIIIHLNVQVPDKDERNADEISEAILACIEVGRDDDSVRDLDIVIPLAEEV